MSSTWEMPSERLTTPADMLIAGNIALRIGNLERGDGLAEAFGAGRVSRRG